MACIISVGMPATVAWGGAHEDFARDVTLSGDNYVAYRGPQRTLSAPPKGYTPFYISHYGRHGSRYLIGESTYTEPVEVLRAAHDAGQLTDRGEQLLRELTTVAQTAHGHIEELTQRGAEQHQQIAERMYDRFPEVFDGDVTVKANSSTVVRCILSMNNALLRLQSRAPQLRFVFDASQGDMWYINHNDKELNREKMPRGSRADSVWHAYRDSLVDYRPIMNRLFRTEDYWMANVKNPRNFAIEQVWKICADMQSTELRHSINLYDLFTAQELENIWLTRNANWYINYAASPLNGGKQPFTQRHLLRKFITEADSALLQKPSKSGSVGATLRYGHEVCVLPLVCLMGLNGYDMQVEDLNKLEPLGWRDYEIFMMGSNVQMIFFRPTATDGDVLVQVLLNEDECTLPQELSPVSGTFYKWQDVRAYYLNKIDAYERTRSDK